MKVSRERLQRESQATGFRPEVLEKVIQLLNLSEGFNRHPFLKGRLTRISHQVDWRTDSDAGVTGRTL